MITDLLAFVFRVAKYNANIREKFSRYSRDLKVVPVK